MGQESENALGAAIRPDDDGEVVIEGYLLKPSWEQMMKRKHVIDGVTLDSTIIAYASRQLTALYN